MQHTAKWLAAGEHLRAALHALAELDEEIATGQHQLFACVMATDTARTLTQLTDLLRRERQLHPIKEWDRCRPCGGIGLVQRPKTHARDHGVEVCVRCDGTGRRRQQK